MIKNNFVSKMIFVIISVSIFFLNGFFYSAEAQTPQISLKFALITQASFPYYDGAAKFKELVEKKTNGKIEVKIYPGAQLGGSRETLEGIREGIIQLGIGDAVFGNMAPVYSIFELPFLMSGNEHMVKIAEGPIGKELATRIEADSGYIVLEWFSTGSPCIQTKNKPVVKADDLRGQKIRVMEVPMLVDTMAALGANPTPMPYAETYMALKQGVIDGALLDLVSVTSLKVSEVVKYITDHRKNPVWSSPRPVVMNAKYFRSLPQDMQKAIQETMLEAGKYQRGVFVSKEKESMDELIKGGITFTQIDFPTFEEKLAPIYDKWTKKLNAVEIVKKIQQIR
jgi:TRAP-type transport system periplasmic protein